MGFEDAEIGSLQLQCKIRVIIGGILIIVDSLDFKCIGLSEHYQR